MASAAPSSSSFHTIPLNTCTAPLPLLALSRGPTLKVSITQNINSIDNGRLRLRHSIANLYPMRNGSEPMPCQDRWPHAWIPHRHSHGSKIGSPNKLTCTDYCGDHLLASRHLVLLLRDRSWEEYCFNTPVRESRADRDRNAGCTGRHVDEDRERDTVLANLDPLNHYHEHWTAALAPMVRYSLMKGGCGFRLIV